MVKCQTVYHFTVVRIARIDLEAMQILLGVMNAYRITLKKFRFLINLIYLIGRKPIKRLIPKTMQLEKEFFAFGEVYQVAERQRENFGEALTSDSEWFEYEVFLQNSDGEIIDSWDSLYETYNGIKGQRLSESRAKSALNEVIEDVNENGNAESWFSI